MVFSVRMFFVCLTLLSAHCLYSQKETSRWFCGHYAELDFRSGNAVSDTNNHMHSGGTSASVADKDGNLLFYSNGVNVYTKAHQVMPNGTGLTGDVISNQGAVPVQNPLMPHIYYLFTVGAVGTGTLAYSTIDMSLAGGTGSVVAKNIVLQTGMTEKLCATMHCNGRDVWVLAHKFHSDKFFAYQVTGAGVDTIPVVSAAGAVHTQGQQLGLAAYQGMMKFSPFGKKLAVVICYPSDTVELFDFNNVTGQVSGGFVLDHLPTSAYGCEFSPDGRLLYVTNNTQIGAAKLFQYDISSGVAATALATKQVIAAAPTPSTHYGLQTGPDGKIYVGAAQASTVPAIANPNSYGAACNYTYQAFILKKGCCIGSFPNFISNYFRQRSQSTFTVTGCGNASFSFAPHNYNPAVNYSLNSVSWDFGDPSSGAANSSTLHSPVHTYEKNGKYVVKLAMQFECHTDTLIDTVVVSSYPELAIEGRNIICSGESTTLSVQGAFSFQWSTGAGTASVQLTPSASTVVLVTATDNNGCQTSRQVSVTVNPCLSLSEKPGFGCRVYPNPAAGTLYFESDREVRVRLYDLSGGLLRQFHVLPGSTSFEIADLHAGVYFLQQEDGIKKLIVLQE